MHPRRACGQRRMEAGVGHVQRGKQRRGQIVAQRSAGNGLDQQAQPVGRNAIMPCIPGVAQQRQAQRGAGARPAGRRGGDIAGNFGLHEGIAKPGSMGEQVACGDRARGGAQDGLTIAVKPAQHLRFGQFGQQGSDRRIKVQLAFLDQLHHRCRDQRLGHRSDLARGIDRHRHPGGHIGLPKGAGGELAIALDDQGNGAGQIGGGEGGFQLGKIDHWPRLAGVLAPGKHVACPAICS